MVGKRQPGHAMSAYDKDIQEPDFPSKEILLASKRLDWHQTIAAVAQHQS